MITCKELAADIKKTIKESIARCAFKPTLDIVTVGDDPASASYVRGKIRDCEEVGIKAKHITLPADVTQEDLNGVMEGCGGDGVILQLPLPKHLDADEALKYILNNQDVDGLKPASPYVPCTAMGIEHWLMSNYLLEGKHVVIINRSNLVGKPLAKLLIEHDATVTMCHSKTKNLYAHTRVADVVVVAVGKPHFIDCNDVKNGAIIVDVGINRVDGKLCGDYQPSYIDEQRGITVTPVPGGVGLLTRVALLSNVLEAHMNKWGE